MMKAFPCYELCPVCEVVITSRSRHCAYCRRCVERYDHHCPWINNCVGLRNHAFFFLFIFSVMSYLVMKIVMIALALSHDTPISEQARFIEAFYKLGCPVELQIAVLIVAGSFVALVAVLNLVHCTNFIRGKTTNERFATKRTSTDIIDEELRTVSSRDSKRSAPLSRVRKKSSITGCAKPRPEDNCLRHFFTMCCDWQMVPQDEVVRKASLASSSRTPLT